MSTLTPGQQSTRLISLDFLRGLIMVFLALEGCGLYYNLSAATEGSATHAVVLQFFHHPWHGIRFWDLVQPNFMFIAGTAMALSLSRQEAMGVPWMQSFKKALKRSFWLFFWGVLNYAVEGNELHWAFSNVLTQLSFTTLVAFLIYRWSFITQMIVCILFLLIREALYRYTNIPGFDQPFVNQHNFGNFMERVLTGRINPEGWVSINFIPTAVHTIAGALAGKLLMSDKEKIRPLLIWGIICFSIGYLLDLSGKVPVIKRIATTSFTLISLGWCLWFLALAYWWIDVKQHRKYLQFFLIVGMNSLFIYLFFEIVGSRWFNEYIGIISNNVLGWLHIPQPPRYILISLIIFILEWLLCYFLYKKKVFIKV